MRLCAPGVVLLLLCTTARAAAPFHDTGWTHADDLWDAAEAEKDPAQIPARWRDAAAAFDAVAADTNLERAERIEAATRAMRGWRNITNPTDDDGQHVVDTATRYLAVAGDSGPDAAEALYARARVHLLHDRLHDAEPDLVAILDHHADSDLAEYAASLLLDLLNREQRYDDLAARAVALHADADLMRRAPALEKTVTALLRQKARLDAEAAAKAGRNGDPAGYERCTAAYLHIYNDAPDQPDADEALFNAGFCAREAGNIGAAITAFGELAKQFPSSRLAARALFLVGMLDSQIAFYDAAADAFEEGARRYPAEEGTRDALSDAIFFRRAIGDLDAADRDAALAAKLFGAKAPDLVTEIAIAIAQDRIEAGERKAGARALTALIPRARRTIDRDRTRALAALAWDAACPVAPTAGLCLAGDRVVARDRKLVAAAHALLASVSVSASALSPSPQIETARLVEAALAIDRPGAELDRALRTAIAAVDALLAAPELDPDTAVAAYAQRERLDLHLARVTHNWKPRPAHERLPAPAPTPALHDLEGLPAPPAK